MFKCKPSAMQFDCLERRLASVFSKYSLMVARFAPWFIIGPILLTGALGAGFLFRNNVLDPVYLYVPNNAQSRVEREIINQHWPLLDGTYQPGKTVTDVRQCQVIATCEDGGNILRSNFSAEVDRLNKFVMNEISLIYQGQSYNYRSLCMKGIDGECFDNPYVTLASTFFENFPDNLTFPAVKFGFQSEYLASSLGGVATTAGKSNSGDQQAIVDSASAWLLVYHMRFQSETDLMISGLWEREFERALSVYKSPLLKLTYFHSQTLSLELQKNSDRLVPKFAVTFVVLVIFSTLCSWVFLPGTPFTDWILSKPLLALCGVVTAGMGVVSSIGFLCFCGLIYNDIISVMPFLVVSVGVNNMFIMMADWRESSRMDPIEIRLSQSMSSAAVAITITALTDVLSFGIGAITNIAVVNIFCTYTCVAIIFTFVYQMTFFMGLVVMGGQMEQRGLHCMFFVPVKYAADKEYSILTRLFLLGSKPSAADEHQESFFDKFFKDWYSPILMHPVIKTLVIIWFAVYIAFSCWGCTQLRQGMLCVEGLKPANLLVSDSYAIAHYQALEKYFWPYGQQLQIVINSPQNLSDPTQRARSMQIVERFCNTKYTIGLESVQFFLPGYLAYLKAFGYDKLVANDSALFNKILKYDYLPLNSSARWRLDVEFGKDNQSEVLTAYRFTLGLRNFEHTIDQQKAMLMMRDVADQFPQHNVTTFIVYWLFCDQYITILPNVLQDLGIGIVCMVLIALFMIPQPLCAVCVALAIASIDVGVIGFMTLWNVNLDAISMITLCMSMGFAVDFSAHIAYSYVINDDSRPNKRIASALAAVGLPILQGASSTVLGIVTLGFVDAYMVVTFFKTVFLVVMVGLLHALFFLPVLLTVLVRGPCLKCGGGNNKRRRTHQIMPTTISTTVLYDTNLHAAKRYNLSPSSPICAFTATSRYPF